MERVEVGVASDPRVAVELTSQPLGALDISRVDADHEVVEIAGEDRLDLGGDHGRGEVPAVQGHGHPGDGVGASGRLRTKLGVGHEMGQLGPLLVEGSRFSRVGFVAGTLVEGVGAPFGDDDRAHGVGTESELDVLAAPLGEALVVSADLLEQRPADPQVAARCDPEVVPVVLEEVVGGTQVGVDPGWYGCVLSHEQISHLAGCPDRLRAEIADFDMAPRAERQDVFGHVMPAGMCLDPRAVGDHVAIEEENDVTAPFPGTEVAGTGQSESGAGLGDDPQAPRERWSRDRGAGAVVDDRDFEERRRVGLGLEGGNRQLELGLALVGRDDDRDSKFGGPRAERRRAEESVVVALDVRPRAFHAHPSTSSTESLSAAAGTRAYRPS